MRRASLLFLATIMACGLSVSAWSAPRSPAAARIKLLKRQQKIERRQLKTQEKIWKRSFHGRRIPRAERLAEEHQFQRNMRDLRQRQKDQIQEIKDQERLAKYRSRHPIEDVY